MKKQLKRVNVVNVELVKESSFLYGNRAILSPSESVDLFNPLIGNKPKEHFVVACLNTKNEPINVSTVSIGTLNKCIVHPRDVLQVALLSNANSIIVCHNHPSGEPTPSEQDISITHRLNECCELMGIKLLDHIILGNKNFISLKEKGYL